MDSEENEVVPMPRMKKPKLRGPAPLVSDTPGTRFWMSVASFSLNASSVSALTTLMEIGTSCSRSSRFCAVTMISSMSRPDVSCAPAGMAMPTASAAPTANLTVLPMVSPF